MKKRGRTTKEIKDDKFSVGYYYKIEKKSFIRGEQSVSLKSI